MAQKTTGLYRLTQISQFYALFQWLLGSSRGQRRLVQDHISPQNGLRVLDLGCGPATVLPLLGQVIYTGIDANPDHIRAAREQYGELGVFICGDFASLKKERSGDFDLVLCLGLLHHLDDERVAELAELACGYLAPGGRFLAVDPAFVARQNPIAKWLAAHDSGQNVREARDYADLLRPAFGKCSTAVRQDLLRIPYTHCITTAEVA